MTVTTQNNTVIYTGNGVATVFSYNFRVPEATDMVVQLLDSSNGDVVQTLAPGSFGVTGIGLEGGGDVTYPLSGSPLDSTRQIFIQRIVPYVQNTDLTNQDGFFPEVIEEQFDLTTMQIQQLAEQQSRSITVPPGTEGITIIPGTAGQTVIFDSEGNLIPADPTTGGNMFKEIYDPNSRNGDVFPFDSKTQAQLATIPSGVKGVTTLGFAAFDDGGGADWVETPAQPSTHDAWFKDAVNHYFIIKNPRLDIRQFGVFGSQNPAALVDESVNIGKALTAAIKLKRPLFVPGAYYQMGAFAYVQDDIALFLEGDPCGQPVFNATQAVADATGGSPGRLMQFLPGSTSYTANEVGVFALDAVGIVPFQQKIKLNTVVGIEPGMMIQIVSDQLWYYDNRGVYNRGEIHLIQKVLPGTNQVQIDDYTRDSYLPGSGHVVTVRVWRPRRFVWDNIALKFPAPAADTANTRGIVIDRMMKPEFNDCHFEGMTGSGILNSRSWLTKYRNIEIRDVGLALDASTSIGYGINEASVYGTHVKGLKARGCRRSIDFDGLTNGTLTAVARDCIVEDFNITGSGIDPLGDEFFPDGPPIAPNFGIGGHGPVENLIIRDGYIADVKQGVNIRSRNTHLENIRFGGELEHCFFGTFGTGLTMKNCSYMRDDFPNKVSAADAETANFAKMPFAFAAFGISTGTGDWNYDSPVVIQNCEAFGMQRGFVELGVSGGGPIAHQNMFVHDNTALVHIPVGNTFRFFNVNGGGDARMWRSKLGPNKMINRGAGAAEMFHSVMNFANNSQGGADAAVEIGDREWLVTIVDDTVAVIRNAVLYSTDRLAIRMTDQSGAMFGDFIVVNASATLTTFGSIPATLVGSAAGSALTGTTGVDGNFTIGLTAPDLYMENRTGGARRMRLKIL